MIERLKADHTETSKAAARHVKPYPPTARQKILEHMSQRPGRAVSAQFMAAEMGTSTNSINGRLNELHEMGLIECLAASGRSPTTGRPVKLYVVSGHSRGRRTQPYTTGEQRRKIEALRTQIRLLGGVPCA